MRYILLVIMAFSAANCFAESIFSIMNHEIKSNSSRSWMQTVADTQLPITVIHGQYPGPVLTLTAGIHGDEFPAIFALQKLRQVIHPDRLHGTLVIVHLANLEGFHGRRVALSPVDEKNLNRIFPGRVDGTLTEQVAYFMTHQIISKTDYLIDIHSGSWNETLLPHVYSPVMNKHALDKKTLAFAKSLGVPHIVLYYERPHDPEHSISYPNTAQTRGKPALTLEVGQLGQSEEQDIEQIYQASMRAMRYLDMYDLGQQDNPDAISSHVALYRKLVDVQSPFTGIFRPYTQVGEQVKQGQAIGQVSDYFGNVLTTLYAPVTGTVLMQKQTPPIRKGESTTDIAITH